MVNICHNMVDAAERYGMKGNYVAGANIAGFEKVVDAMNAQVLFNLKITKYLSVKNRSCRSQSTRSVFYDTSDVYRRMSEAFLN